MRNYVVTSNIKNILVYVSYYLLRSRAIHIISKYMLTLKNQISVSIFAQRFAYLYAKSGGNVFDCARDRSIFAPFKENQIPDLFGEHLISCLPK